MLNLIAPFVSIQCYEESGSWPSFELLSMAKQRNRASFYAHVEYLQFVGDLKYLSWKTLG